MGVVCVCVLCGCVCCVGVGVVWVCVCVCVVWVGVLCGCCVVGVCGCVYQMVSAERVIQYSSLEPEASLETRPPNEKPSFDWPQRGEIILDDVSFRYSKDTPLVLKSLSLIINPAEKVSTLAPIGNSALFCYVQVGIVGRTGAGKSSLIALLFRLAEPFGRLVIDGVQITSIGLHDLRSKMSIIPQVIKSLMHRAPSYKPHPQP